MSFLITPTRRALLVRACGLFFLAAVFGLLPLIYKTDTLGQVFVGILVAVCVLVGILCLWARKRTSPAATVTRIPQLASTNAQVRYFRRMLWLSLTIVPAVLAWMAYEVYQVDSGAVKEISVWWPIALVYTRFGYWPVTLLLLFLCVALPAVFAYKLHETKSLALRDEQQKHEMRLPEQPVKQ
jgi:hypothetical protein